MRDDLRGREKLLIYTALPVGSFHGWGVCGKYLTRELSRLAEVRLITDTLSYESLQDELDYRFLKGKAVGVEEYNYIKGSKGCVLDGTVIQSIVGNTLVPLMPQLKGSLNIGYTFFEDNILSREVIENGKSYFDHIVTGSTWNEQVLRSYGLGHVSTVIQGIDPTIFNPLYCDKEYFLDQFVIFSGGKFELRKGQDLVIRAFKHIQHKYRDVTLITAWHNFWPQSMNTMVGSPHISFSPSQSPCEEVIRKTLVDNGVNLDRVIILPALPNVMMARIYKNTDIGLFTNRCEGGTNLVLMEYMACGKPVIATYNTGHMDILTGQNAILLKQMTPLVISDGTKTVAHWNEPNIDELIAHLEEAYINRHSLRALGLQAGRDLSKKTWKASAMGFYEVILRLT
jgi:glycosyltransferase involved in cell wall biosynthesis